MISKSIIDKAVIDTFEMYEKKQRQEYGGAFPVRLTTWQVKRLIGDRYSNPQLRASCRRLVLKGLLKEDPDYSNANHLSWRFK